MSKNSNERKPSTHDTLAKDLRRYIQPFRADGFELGALVAILLGVAPAHPFDRLPRVVLPMRGIRQLRFREHRVRHLKFVDEERAELDLVRWGFVDRPDGDVEPGTVVA